MSVNVRGGQTMLPNAPSEARKGREGKDVRARSCGVLLRGRAGFSIVEVIAVMIITSSTLLGVLAGISYGFDILKAQHDRRVAIALCQKELDYWKRTILFNENIDGQNWSESMTDRIIGDWVYETGVEDPNSQRWRTVRDPVTTKREPFAPSIPTPYYELIVRVQWDPRIVDSPVDEYEETAFTLWVPVRSQIYGYGG
jgi:type II secretory pathway pseudopilin PulG